MGAGPDRHHHTRSSGRFGAVRALGLVARARGTTTGFLLLAGILGVVAVTFAVVRLLYHGRVRRTAPWDCGYPWQTPRMQDTAEGFGQPIRHIFGPFFRMERELPSPWDSAPRYRIQVEDRVWLGIYLPIGRGVQRLTDAVAILQGGRLAVYLLYAFLTLIALLVFVL